MDVTALGDGGGGPVVEREGEREELAHTGANAPSMAVLGVAGALAAAGVGAVTLARRRAAQ